uniref:Uncharacterized protein n=1 Tax=Panagrolaimus sp. PS1159 TaxID=55785 RepID=A0AC35FK31_9BILA
MSKDEGWVEILFDEDVEGLTGGIETNNCFLQSIGNFRCSGLAFFRIAGNGFVICIGLDVDGKHGGGGAAIGEMDIGRGDDDFESSDDKLNFGFIGLTGVTSRSDILV